MEFLGLLCFSVLVDVLVGSDVDVDADVDADDAAVDVVVGADVDVVVGGAFALSPPSWQTPHEDPKLFSFGSFPALQTPAEKIPLSTLTLSSFC